MKNCLKTFALLAVFLFAVSCSQKEQSNVVMYDMEAAVAEPQQAFAKTGNIEQLEENAAAATGSETTVERKLIKSASLRIRVENLKEADAAISALMEKHSAYSASTNIEENSRHYSLRVPAPYYDTFLADMNGLGRLLNRHENTEDVTLRYYDLEGRLATKKELLKTFQSYLGKAKNIEEILSVEARIAELQYDIEGTGIELRNLANRVEYATIDVSVFGPVAADSSRNLTFSERIKSLFGNFGGFLSSAVVVIVGFVIYGIPLLLIFGLLFRLLFGRVGLLKKLWRIIAGKKQS